MKKIIIMAFLILAAAVAGILLIHSSRPDTDVTAKRTKIGLLLNGPRTDQSYCQAHYEALKSLEDDLNLEIICHESVPVDCDRNIAELIRNEDCKIIIAVSYPQGASMERAAEKYPEVYFLHATGLGHRNNLSSFFGRMYQARYLSGIIAGMQTETGRIGYVAAFPIPEVIRGINAFTLGARSVRPDAVVYVRYANSWTRDDMTKTACWNLLNSHPIDLLTLHSNSIQPLREAEARGIWSIGYNMDNAAEFPNTYLTACVWKWDVYYRKQILNCLQGKFHGDHDWLNLEDGIVELSDFTDHVDERTKAAVRNADERLRSREFDVFYGPIKDNAGNLRIEAGESMSDDEMLNGFDWYVEGVTIEK